MARPQTRRLTKGHRRPSRRLVSATSLDDRYQPELAPVHLRQNCHWAEPNLPPTPLVPRWQFAANTETLGDHGESRKPFNRAAPVQHRWRRRADGHSPVAEAAAITDRLAVMNVSGTDYWGLRRHRSMEVPLQPNERRMAGAVRAIFGWWRSRRGGAPVRAESSDLRTEVGVEATRAAAARDQICSTTRRRLPQPQLVMRNSPGATAIRQIPPGQPCQTLGQTRAAKERQGNLADQMAALGTS